MSRSKTSEATAKAKERMDATRRAERRAYERAKRTGNPSHRRRYIIIAGIAQAAQDAYHEACKADKME